MAATARHPTLHRLAHQVGEVEALDAPAEKLLDVAQTVLRPGRLRDALSGTFLGHPLHPLMTDLPIGAWTSATFLDHFGGRRSETAARRLVGLGIATSIPTAVTGYVEWADSASRRAATRRVGLAHAAANVAALGFYGASFLARRRSGGGKMLALAGAAALGAGGHLGGHLAYVHGEGVAVTSFEEGADEWTEAMPEAELEAGRPACAVVAGVPVLLVREGEAIHALANRCNHRGGPLHRGKVEDGRVTCPWHGSVFELSTGDLEHGPAASPQPAYEARALEGRIEVRQVSDPTP